MLTFDDGPDRYTEAVLTVLRAYGVHATFFVMGVKARAHPELIRAEMAAGHQVENHSWSHPHLSDLSRPELDQQLDDTQKAIVVAGAPPPTLMRPPFGDADPDVDTAAARAHLTVVRWSLDTNDWRGRAPGDITAAVLNQLSPGQVVLMHDGVQESHNTLAALPGIIRGLRDRGYCTTTMTAG
jgi:peptidoglycan/xylan/chitin deacetylase (PgdA/CDA1 family)